MFAVQSPQLSSGGSGAPAGSGKYWPLLRVARIYLPPFLLLFVGASVLAGSRSWTCKWAAQIDVSWASLVLAWWRVRWRASWRACWRACWRADWPALGQFNWICRPLLAASLASTFPASLLIPVGGFGFQCLCLCCFLGAIVCLCEWSEFIYSTERLANKQAKSRTKGSSRRRKRPARKAEKSAHEAALSIGH